MVPTKERIRETASETPLRMIMTEAEFVAWCDEDTWAEWVDGEVIVASPASIHHVRIAGFLLGVIAPYARRRGLGEAFGPEAMVRLAGLRRRRVPDLFFIAKERLNLLRPNHFEGAPDLTVEIVSPDSVSRDWRVKYLEYERAGVREYWVVDPLTKQVETYALGEDGQFLLVEEQDGALHSVVIPGLYIRTEWLWQEPPPDSIEILRELGAL